MEEKGGILKNTKALEVIQIILAAAAAILAIVAIVRNTNLNREIIYVGQATISMFILVAGVKHFKDKEISHLTVVMYALGILEALRAALLLTESVNAYVGSAARFLLAILACICVLIADRLERSGAEKLALCYIILEVALYLVFLIGFPGVLLGRINRFLPLVSIFIAVSVVICLKVKRGKLEEEKK